MKSDKRGFTFIELIITMVITGILAGIAAVSMQNMTQRAIIAEGVAGLGRVRQAIREWYNINGAYPAPAGETRVINFVDITTGKSLDINTGELDGTYFSKECYYIAAGGDPIRCYLDNGVNTAPKAAITRSIPTVAVFNRRIVIYVADGSIVTSGIPNSGYQ